MERLLKTNTITRYHKIMQNYHYPENEQDLYLEELEEFLSNKCSDYDLCIEQKFKGESGYQMIGYKRFLELTEVSGYWKKGTALQELKDNGKVMTPYSIFTLSDNSQRK